MSVSINYKKKLGTFAILLLLVPFIIIISTLKTEAKESTKPEPEKFYRSITIEAGDTLWSIAEEYKPSEDIPTQEYVRDLKIINNLSSDTIHAGNYLSIYYYNE